MDKGTISWDLLESFLAVAEEGSLSAAAQRRGLTQPTLGRHIRSAEAGLGLSLFRRRARGLELTEAAADLLEDVRAMRTAAARLSRRAAGRDQHLRGTVRITASNIMSHFVLPPVIARLRAAEPEIEIELHASDSTENLLFGEADIAVRMYRPEQLDTVARKVGDAPMGLYAAKDYLARAGEPRNLADFAEHALVGYDRSDLILRHMRALGVPAERQMFATRCDDQAAYWHLVVAGCGIGAGQRRVGDAEPRVCRILHDVPIPPLPIWLAAPQALRRSPRIRRVWDTMAAALAEE